MSKKLAEKEVEFVRRMASTREKSEWGFELLLEKRGDRLGDFFDELRSCGLFSPERNLGPVPAETEGYVHIPYWPALKYLEAVAKLAGKNEDRGLSNKIMDILREVTYFRNEAGEVIDNYHTFRTFAEILNYLPLSAVSVRDLEMISIWLSSKYDSGGVVVALNTGYFQRLLRSESKEEREKGIVVLDILTKLKEAQQIDVAKDKNESTVADKYWLSEFLKSNSEALGRKFGAAAADIIADRLSKLFSSGLPSYWDRPAIEDHPQNHSWNEVQNAFIESLRDILISWASENPEEVKKYIQVLYKKDLEVLRRISIFVLDEQWDNLNDIYESFLDEKLFDVNHWHELYRFLASRYQDFKPEWKARTLNLIENISNFGSGDIELKKKRTQRDWLSAIYEKGSDDADELFRQLESNKEIGELSEHPDFLSYATSWTGPGPSPFTKEELLDFFQEKNLIEKINGFVETDHWFGPTKSALSQVLGAVVKDNLKSFVGEIHQFRAADYTYQYAVLNAFKEVWESEAGGKSSGIIDWEFAWRELVGFIEQLVGDDDFWSAEVADDENFTPNRDWIPPIVAELIRKGTQTDDWAYSPELLPRTRKIVQCLLNNVAPEDELGDDPMHMAINSPRGKAIEALFDHSLREARLSDKEKGDHVAVWEELEEIYNSEISRTTNANFEFSTLAAAYISNISYLSKLWLVDNINKIFSETYASNFDCAVNGLAYASANRPIYKILVESGVIQSALKKKSIGRQTRQRLLERIALAYLWSDEDLESPRLKYLFDHQAVEDLEDISDLFWAIKNQNLSDDQKARILSFFDQVVMWALSLDATPSKLLSSLSKLTVYIGNPDERQVFLLKEIAPYATENYVSDHFIEEMLRIAQDDPEKANQIVKVFFRSFKTVYDFEDKLKRLIASIAQAGGNLKIDAISYANQFRHLKGMGEVYEELNRGGG